MPKLVRIAAYFAAVIVMVAVFGPYLMGIYLKNNYNSTLVYFNSIPGIHAQPTLYKRAWFSSDTILYVDVNNSDYLKGMESLGVPDNIIPRRYTIKQHIQHGPFIYNRSSDLPWFGVSAIQNEIQLTPNIQRLYLYLGVDDHFIQNSNEFISFSGEYFYHFKFSGINLVYPGSGSQINFSGLESHIWFNPNNDRVNGDIRADSIVLENQGDSIAMPDIKYEFYLYLSDLDLWLGTSSLTISKLSAMVREGFQTVMTDIDYHSNTDIVAGKFNSEREINIGKLQYNDQTIGPMYFQGSVNKINAQALATLLAAYHEIKNRGELYSSQLEQRMYVMLPRLVNSGSNIELNTLDITTSRGSLHASGQLRWDMNTESVPDELPELIKTANGQFDMRISKLLLNDLIEFYVSFPLINDISLTLSEEEAQAASDEIYYNMEKNSQLIDSLVESGQLRDVDAMDLVALQKDMVTIQDYAGQINQILWNKYLTLQTSYLLYWGYLGVDQSIAKLEKMIQASQDSVKASIHAKIKALLKEGYLIEGKDDYAISIKQKNGELKFNKN
jgi:uncharacterized protein YdgA (DUF945 family)